VIGGDPLRGVGVFHVIFEHRVQNLVGRQRVAVFLVGRNSADGGFSSVDSGITGRREFT
jgi:hypothetical protein